MFNRQEATFTANYNGVSILVTVAVSGDKLSVHSDGPLGTGFPTGSIPSVSDVSETFDIIVDNLTDGFHELEHLDEERLAASDPMAQFFGFDQRGEKVFAQGVDLGDQNDFQANLADFR